MAKNFQFSSWGDVEKSGWWSKLPPDTEDVNVENLELFFSTMFERQEIWYKRFILKQKQPWTKDPYFKDYKFTNVYRELDRASQWLINNVLLDHSITIEDLIFRIIIYRFYNQPDTFSPPKQENWDLRVKLPYFSGFSAKQIHEQTVRFRRVVDNPWHTAYMMNIAFLKMPKDYVSKYEGGLFKDYAYCEVLFKKVHEWIIPFCKKLLRAEIASPEELIKEFEKLPAVSGFQSHEFFLDFCYVTKYWKFPIIPWNENDYTNVGPGASLGLRLVFPSLPPERQKEGIYWLRDLSNEQLNRIGDFKYLGWRKETKEYVCPDFFSDQLTLHAMEMWLCEFSKYIKMTWKEGKQRSKFILKTK